MSYSLISLDDGHILVFDMHDDFESADDMPKYLPECYAALENGPDAVVLITDTTKAPLRNLDDLIQGANSIRNPLSQQINNHPKLLASMTVVDNKMVQLAVRGLNSAAFGFVNVQIYATQEEALAHARTLLAEKNHAART